jgi:hypothetical protein
VMAWGAVGAKEWMGWKSAVKAEAMRMNFMVDLD